MTRSLTLVSSKQIRILVLLLKSLNVLVMFRKGVGLHYETLTNNAKIIINEKPVLVLQKLTHKFINKLQNYYGIAIRQNCPTGDVNVMRNHNINFVHKGMNLGVNIRKTWLMVQRHMYTHLDYLFILGNK